MNNENKLSKEKKGLKKLTKRQIVIGVLLILLFTAFYSDGEHRSARQLYGPHFGDDYLVEQVSCQRGWSAGWAQIFSVWAPWEVEQFTRGVVINGGGEGCGYG